MTQKPKFVIVEADEWRVVGLFPNACVYEKSKKQAFRIKVKWPRRSGPIEPRCSFREVMKALRVKGLPGGCCGNAWRRHHLQPACRVLNRMVARGQLI